ncbi:MAG: ornithine carbamoyltransferase [Planctomycetes bacterium]|nr:ornithine carbamoyltransferase [Planctomycetota bacterium]
MTTLDLSTLAPRHLLRISDLTATEILRLVRLALHMKRDLKPFAGDLAQRSLALLFEKPSLRTRVSFEAGFQKLGGGVIFLDHTTSHIGQRESVEDTARNLSRWVDAVVIRCVCHDLLNRFAAVSDVPVINALSDLHHPCQTLADLAALSANGIDPSHANIAWVGDGNNVCHSLVEAVATLGGRLQVITPATCRPSDEVLQTAAARAFRSGATITCTDKLAAVEGVDAVYTDVWVSMGEGGDPADKRERLRPYQVNAALMERAGPQARFMHCLPAHRGEEVTADILDGPRSITLDQAEFRMHAQNALLLSLLRPDIVQRKQS